MLVTYYALTRALFAIARDRLLPPILTRLSRTQVPVGATMLSGIAMALLAGFVPLGELAQFANAAILAEFLFVCCAVIVLRLTTPDEDIMNMHMPRQFRIPGGIVIPVLGAIMCLALIAFLPPATVLGFVLWLVTGMAAYFVLAVPFRRDRSA
jgi:APA family basic amino acid/polyamine antiporter